MSEKRSAKRATPKPGEPTPAPSTPIGGSPMNLQLLEQLVKLMGANDLSAIDLRDGDKRIALRRGAVVQTASYTPVQHSFPASAAQPPSPPTATQASSPPAEDAVLVAIKSPMVGTFYAAATPEAKPFVSVGSTIDDETDVCIIEAMKVFNSIKAETRGTIAKVLVTNGQTVEFGQPLFMVKP